MANQESTTRTLLVALVVCLVSSVFVAGAAVALKPTQAENRLLDKQRSILAIAGLGEPGMSGKEVKALFDSRITAKVVDLQSGTFSDAQDPLGYDPLKAAKDPALSEALPAAEDIASIKRRERYTTVYLVETDGKLDTLILPVRGYGLWSTLYGFLALTTSTRSPASASTSMARPPVSAARSTIRNGRRCGSARPSTTPRAILPYRSSRARWTRNRRRRPTRSTAWPAPP